MSVAEIENLSEVEVLGRPSQSSLLEKVKDFLFIIRHPCWAYDLEGKCTEAEGGFRSETWMIGRSLREVNKIVEEKGIAYKNSLLHSRKR